MLLQTKFLFKADAVISAESKADAWRRIAQLANNAADGHPDLGAFLSGGMSMEPDGQHLSGPRTMTGPAEDALVAVYHKKVIEQGERLALDEVPDPLYSMMIGFAIAHDCALRMRRSWRNVFITAKAKRATNKPRDRSYASRKPQRRICRSDERSCAALGGWTDFQRRQ
jgi:hypothetical protein